MKRALLHKYILSGTSLYHRPDHYKRRWVYWASNDTKHNGRVIILFRYAAHVLSFIYRYIMDAKTNEKKKKQTHSLGLVECECNKNIYFVTFRPGVLKIFFYKNVVLRAFNQQVQGTWYPIQFNYYCLWYGQSLFLSFIRNWMF